MTATKKKHIAKSYRLRTARGIVAFSERVYQGIERRITRLEGIFVILRGEGDEVMQHLYRAVSELPEHFTEGSREILGVNAAV